MSRRLIHEVFHEHFRGDELARDHDGGYLSTTQPPLAMTTDSFIVSPPFFPGGDIGSLAVHGTVNDLAACGARARWMSAAFILEEGLMLTDVERIAASMARAATVAGVEIVTGDTKVVERGKGDGIFITTCGVGEVLGQPPPDPRAVRRGDCILLSGPIGLHGMAVMSQREGLGFEAEIRSDSAPLGDLVSAVYRAGLRPHCMRDPTRGGVAAALWELAQDSGTSMVLNEASIPVPEPVRGACELLGLDPLLVANEGKMLLLSAREDATRTLEVLRDHPLGRESVLIGEVTSDEPGLVMIRTTLGSLHILDIPAGEELPRIC
jgi:hydrogenase expression/formation protein HypE